MARPINKLTARKVAALSKPGRHGDGGGLYLRITTAGQRSWIFISAKGDKRVELGLGAASSVGLAAAREIATKMREAAAHGQDPKSVLASKTLRVEPEMTFGEFSDYFITSVESGWKNPVHRQQWRTSLRDHANSLKDKALTEINTDEILNVLQPIWIAKPETASRVRGRIERILDAAKARGLRPSEGANPARLKGHLDLLLPMQPKLVRGHHAALPYKDGPSFMKQLQRATAPVARCLEFTILTAARSGEALGATWGEIDLNDQIWRIPGERMKAGVEHIVPLSSSAVRILSTLRPKQPEQDAPVFAVRGKVRSNMAMAMLLRRMNVGHVTTHGFRSTFRDWAGDCSECPREVVEAALAHTIQSKTEAAYRRSTALERRRKLMQEWDDYLSAKPRKTAV